MPFQIEGLSVELEAAGGPVPVVSDVTLAVAPGEILCLVGESGCGKSVTARAAMRLLSPPLRMGANTRLLLDGRDLATLPEREMRQVRGRDIAMIFQEPMSALNPVWEVGEQVAEGPRQHLGLSRRAAAARAVDLLRQVGIPSPERRARQFPHELSGGMQQRAMIAMALACGPKVLVADEPTTALDTTIQAQILDLLRVEQARLGMAILLITHDLGVVAEVGTHVAVMYAGRIVETGAAAAVLRAPQHPYTQALVESIPRLGMRRDRRLNAIGGTVPSPFDMPAGCAFRARCRHAFARCAALPPLFGEGARRAACWLRAEMAGAAP